MISGQELERVYSFNLGARTGLALVGNFCSAPRLCTGILSTRLSVFQILPADLCRSTLQSFIQYKLGSPDVRLTALLGEFLCFVLCIKYAAAIIPLANTKKYIKKL